MSPKHSIDYCPICGGGLCGIRVCGLPTDKTRSSESSSDESPSNESPKRENQSAIEPHGLIVCDECEAIWLDPDTSTDHQYPRAENAACPICSQSLWGEQSRWATIADVQLLGWNAAVNPALDVNSDEEIA